MCNKVLYNVTKYIIIKLLLLFVCYVHMNLLILDIKNYAGDFGFGLFSFAMNKFICLSWR